jgi:Holliday junction resolvase-like predicted endonuclease
MQRQSRREVDNVGVRNGAWGEDVAVEFLRVHGYEIVGRNVRPCSRDRRLEIDVVAYDRMYDVIAFVEVKQHAERSPLARRIRSVNRHKLDLLRRACRTWLAKERWRGGYRFDVIEVYGSPGKGVRTEIDHVPGVRLFERPARFVDWNN